MEAALAMIFYLVERARIIFVVMREMIFSKAIKEMILLMGELALIGCVMEINH